MNARLIWAIVSTILEEAGIAVVVLLGLPQLGIIIPLPGLVAIMVTWGAVTVIMYRVGSRTLMRKPVVGLPDMIGSSGRVVRAIDPVGQVKIRNEFWDAKSAGDKIKVDEEITVLGQEGLTLIVGRVSSED